MGVNDRVGSGSPAVLGSNQQPLLAAQLMEPRALFAERGREACGFSEALIYCLMQVKKKEEAHL